MEPRTRGSETRSLLDRELVVCSHVPVPDRVGIGPHSHDAERRKRGIVERGRALEIGCAERKMIKHASFVL